MPSPKILSPSLLIALLIWSFIGWCILQPRQGTSFTWDSFGYHLYLPAVVVAHDPLLKDLDRVDRTRKELDASGTLYQITTLEGGSHVIKYPMGLAVIWSPWFMAGHIIAGITGQAQDGYSQAYDRTIRLGVWVYLLLGLLALRAVLRSRFSEGITGITLLLLFAATNLLDQAITGTTMPHLPLFCIYAGILWATLRWTRDRSPRDAFFLAVLMGLAVLIRPSEGLCLLLPFLWRGEGEEPAPFSRAWKLRKQWIMIAVVMFLIGLPQFIYWKATTGHWFLDTYNNPGEGFDLLTPHTWSFLFSFRKGWYIYTPLMLVATVGLVCLRKYWREAFLPLFAFLLLSIYLLSSWTCWWYADSFSSRAMVGAYAVLALPLAAVLQWSFAGSLLRKIVMALLFVGCTALNLFQYWQYRNGIIDSSRMTWRAYVADLGATERPADLDGLLLVRRSYTSDQGKPDSTRYSSEPLVIALAQLPAPDTTLLDTATGISIGAYRLNGDHPFSPALRIPFNELTTHDHAWVEAVWQVMTMDTTSKGSFVSTFEHKGNYGYTTQDLDKEVLPKGRWITVRTYYLTPEIRSTKDLFASYFWLRDTTTVFVAGPRLIIHQPLARP